MSVIGSNVLAGASGAGGAAAYQIDRSLRFNSADSAYLSRTPSSAGNRKTWTWSGWIKLGKLASSANVHEHIMRVNTGPETAIRFKKDGNADCIQFYTYSGSLTSDIQTSAVFRDHSAWYHLVVACDTGQSTSSERVKIYINGVLQSLSTSAYPSQNYDTGFNTTNAHGIAATASGSELFDGYLAEVHFIDGQALAPTDFGEYDSDNNWNPKAYSGSYGTNGFYLKFADNSSNAALGTDSSGNSNTWTVNNLSIGGQAYSSGVTTSIDSSSPATNAFDGSQSTHTRTSGTSVVLNVNFNPGIAVTSSVEIQGEQGYITPNCSITVDGTTTTAGGDPNTAVSGTAGTTTKTFSGVSGTLTNLKVGKIIAGRTYLSRILIDGVALVDGNPSNTDSLIDTPTNYTASPNNGGNYATLNPLHHLATATLANGNLQTTSSNPAFSTFLLKSGKWYCEHTVTATGYNLCFSQIDHPAGATPSSANSESIGWYTNGTLYWQGGSASAGASYGIGDVLGAAIDMDNTTITLYKNGTQTTSINFSSGYHVTFAEGMYVSQFNGTGHFNFGQRQFAYPVSGYKSICTTNLPDPTIADGSTAFNTVLYSGTGANQSITGLSFGSAPDFVWIKRRNGSGQHVLTDSVRGTNKQLFSSLSNAEQTSSTGISSFDTNGFSLGTNVSPTGSTNGSGSTYVAWAWDAGTSTVSNTDGNITSSVRASQTNGISIVSFTGNNTNGATVGHGLNAVPEFAIFKDRDSTKGWTIYHKDITPKVLDFTTTASFTSQEQFNQTAPTSSVFTLGSGGRTNQNGNDIIAYCFAPVEGFSAMGSYVGNGSTDGPFVALSFRPAFLLLKRINATGNWLIYDNRREGYNFDNDPLYANLTDAEGTTDYLDLLSNGFKLRNTHGSVNGSSDTYIYAAFAEHPFKTARAR